MALNHCAIPCNDTITSIEKEEFYQLLARLLSMLAVNQLLVIDDLLAFKKNRSETTPFLLVNELVDGLAIRLFMIIYTVLEMTRLRTKNGLLKKQPHTDCLQHLHRELPQRFTQQTAPLITCNTIYSIAITQIYAAAG